MDTATRPLAEQMGQLVDAEIASLAQHARQHEVALVAIRAQIAEAQALRARIAGSGPIPPDITTREPDQPQHPATGPEPTLQKSVVSPSIRTQAMRRGSRANVVRSAIRTLHREHGRFTVSDIMQITGQTRDAVSQTFQDYKFRDRIIRRVGTRGTGRRREALYEYIEPPNTAPANRPTYDKPTDRVATGPVQGTGKGTRGGSKDVSDVITSLRLKNIRVEQNGAGHWSAHRNGKSVTFSSSPSDPNWKQIVTQDLKKHLGVDLRG